MPNTLSAKKAFRQDEKKRVKNLRVKRGLKIAIKTAKTLKTEKEVLAAIKLIDKAAQIGSIKKGNAARKKSRLWKQLKSKTEASNKNRPTKKTAKRTSKKKS